MLKYKIIDSGGNMHRKLGLVLMLVILSTMFAEVSGEYGFQMLKINASSSIMALGGTGAYYTNDGLNFLSNPVAGIDFHGKILSFSHNYWLFDTKLSSLGYRNSNGKSSFGVSYRALDYGKFERRDEVGNEIQGEYHPLDLGIVLNYARRINPDHYIGINMTGLYEKIDTASSIGLAFDLGYLYKTPVRDLHLQATLKNIGFTTKMKNEADNLPFTADFSVIKKMNIANVNFFTEGKMIYHIDDEVLKGAVGMMTNFYQLFHLRIGYKFNYDLENFTAGFGIHYNRFIVDYTFLPVEEELDSVHMFSVSIQL